DERAARAATEDVATLAHHAFRASLSHLVPHPGEVRSPEEERALDALVAFLNGLTRYVDQHPGTGLAPYLSLLEAEAGGDLDPWVPPPPGPGRVAVTSIIGAAGQEWDTVVLTGCVEGELPRLGGAVRFFDRAVLHGGPVPSVADRRRAALDQERRLFRLAATRATGTFVSTAAPDPGVHVSRFVERWSPRPPRLALGRVSLSPPLDPTPGTAPMWPEGSLSLSATQLDTFEDCPLKHAYRYGLGIRTAGGVHAALGTLVHAVLARFLDPARPGPHTRERLLALAEDCWSDDLAPYRPQLEEARRDLYDMLELWWEKEGSLGAGGPDVLATERPFTIPIGPHEVAGRIDRLDRDEGGGVGVVDYKTGKRRPREADVADDLQLATYRLAALRDPDLAAWGPPTQVRILHLRSMEAFDQSAGPGHAEATEARILSTAWSILAEEREPAVDADCDHCELHRLCPLWPEGREVGQA
ncbi:MAG TPA: PD-(D/E)XK nuclease family protein, partial [Acidimicrobiales bacterium]|nr:PD-(D/E)XK nuclease family protein [Acidimicrobiales bacterium]